MKSNLKTTLALIAFVTVLLSDSTIRAQSSCSPKEQKTGETPGDEQEYNNGTPSFLVMAESIESTSGCKPSSCRGAKTKFGEAKVISTLRTHLIALKAEMEASKTPKFEERSFDIHDIVGETDEESLGIIIREVKLMENDFSNKTSFRPLIFSLPENKAKQVKYLENRIAVLKGFL